MVLLLTRLLLPFWDGSVDLGVFSGKCLCTQCIFRVSLRWVNAASGLC